MTDRARILQGIADTADALTEPHQHAEPVHDYDPHRNKRLRRVYVTTQPGLLQALYDALDPVYGATENSGSGYRSTPPLCLEALSRHAAIQVGVAKLCWTICVEQRDTTASSIRAIVGAAGALDDQQLRDILAELRTWRTWCAVMTGWQTPAYAPSAACPACEKTNALRINLARRTAMCTNCDASWDDTTIGVLANYIRTASEAA